MISWLKRLLASRSRTFNQALGDVVSEGELIQGTTRHSYAKYRLKKSVDGEQCFISVEFKPDYYAGPEGTPKNWIDFDLNAAVRFREALDACITDLRMRAAPKPGERLSR